MSTFRGAYAVVGLGFAIIIGALFMVNHGFTKKGHTGSLIATSTLKLSSSAFNEYGSLPERHTCDAEGTPPPLSIEGAPAATKSFVLIVSDPDVPKQLKADGRFLHWLLFNIPADARAIGAAGSIGISGMSGAGTEGYVPPCPPKGYEPSRHRYVFQLYALDTNLGIEAGSTEEDVNRAMQGHILAESKLTGTYQRK